MSHAHEDCYCQVYKSELIQEYTGWLSPWDWKDHNLDLAGVVNTNEHGANNTHTHTYTHLHRLYVSKTDSGRVDIPEALTADTLTHH